MKKYFNLIFCIFCINVASSQNSGVVRVSFADTIAKYFNYDTLRQIPCAKSPPGIYAVAFRLHKKKVSFDSPLYTDSLSELNTLFVSAIRNSLGKMHLKKKNKKYLQFFYFNTLLGCNSINDTAKFSGNINSEVSKILSFQLYSIRTSLKKLIKNPAEYYILPCVIIDDNNPAIRTNRREFINDTKPKSFTPKEIETMEKMVQETKGK
jgi:hypothetical protein